MTDWIHHKSQLGLLFGPAPDCKLSPEMAHLKTLLAQLFQELESDHMLTDSRIAGLESAVDTLRVRLDKFTAREEDMVQTGVPKQDRPAAHRGLDRIEGDDNG